MDLQVTNLDGENINTKWIKFLGNGEVLVRAREREDEPEYVVSLYLESNYSQCPTSPMPYWFVKILQSINGAYHTLAEATKRLNDPTTFAEVERYQRHHDQ
jgi:hypothetical protein